MVLLEATKEEILRIPLFHQASLAQTTLTTRSGQLWYQRSLLTPTRSGRAGSLVAILDTVLHPTD